MKTNTFTIPLIIVFFSSHSLLSQDHQSVYNEKVSTIDSIIETLYSVISGDAGVKRDWDLFRFLFTENAHLIPTRTDRENNSLVIDYITPEGYIQRSGKWLEENGFFEKEISRQVQSFGSMTHVFSTYASFRKSSDTEPFTRGINSIQLFNDGERWWIVNIYWTGESEGNPIPTAYLPK